MIETIKKDESSCQELREKIVPSAKHVSMEDLLAAMVSRFLNTNNGVWRESLAVCTLQFHGCPPDMQLSVCN